jgi:transposase-like protein
MEKNNRNYTVQRRNFTPAQKVAILKEHLLGSIPVSEVCLRHDLQPTIYYRWQTQFFENGFKAFEVAPPKPKTEPLRAKITQLEEKLVRKNEVVSELMETHLQLKKSLGEL